MKKAFVIITVLILLACSVFASETHLIRVKSVVESKAPTFVLKAGLTPEAFDRAVSDEKAANMLGWETVEKSIKTEDIVVFFEVVQKGDAKETSEKYFLTIEASEMILGYNEDGSALAPDSNGYRTTKGKISEVIPINTEKAIIEVMNAETSSKDIATLEAEYNGRVADGTPIAKFTVTGAKDTNAPDGIYQASVVLKVSKQ